VEYTQISCSGKEGTFGAIDMIEHLHVDVIIGPGCGVGKRDSVMLLYYRSVRTESYQYAVQHAYPDLFFFIYLRQITKIHMNTIRTHRN